MPWMKCFSEVNVRLRWKCTSLWLASAGHNMPSTMLRGFLDHKEYYTWELALLQCLIGSELPWAALHSWAVPLLSPAVTLPWQMPSPVSSGVTTCPPCWPSSPSPCPSPSSRTRWRRPCRRWAGPCPPAPCSAAHRDAAAAPGAFGQEPAGAHLLFPAFWFIASCLVPKNCGDVQGERMLCAGKAQS